VKTRSLQETLRLHRFYNSCQEFESWIEDKENVLNTCSTDADHLGAVQAKYEVKIMKTLQRMLQSIRSTKHILYKYKADFNIFNVFNIL